MSVKQQEERGQQPAVRVAHLTPQERAAVNILTPEERKRALLAAAREKALGMVEESGL